MHLEVDPGEYVFLTQVAHLRQEFAGLHPGLGKEFLHLAPHHIPDQPLAGHLARARLEIHFPSRNTVTRSAICEYFFHAVADEQDQTPWSRSERVNWNNCSASCAESEAVGSSMISTRTLSEMALAISMVC